MKATVLRKYPVKRSLLVMSSALAVVIGHNGPARASNAALYSITSITFPNYPFGTGEGFGINDAGQMVGEAQNASGLHAFVYSAGSLTDLGTLGGADSQAFAINSTGQIAGDAMLNSGLHHPFTDNGSTMTDLTPSASYAGYANGINAGGQEVGTLLSGTSGGANAFLYSSGVLSAVGTLGGAHSSAFGINANGQIAGGADTTNGVYHAFIKSGSALTDLGTLGGTSSVAYAINSGGDAAGAAEISGGAYHAFLYSGGTMHDLGTLGGSTSYAYALNSLDMVVGQSLNAAGTMDGSVYYDGILQDINNLIAPGSGWTINNAHGINLSGQIAGTGRAPNGSVQAVLLTPTTLSIANNSTVSAVAGLVENPIAFSGNSTGGELALTGTADGITAGISIAGGGTVNTIDGGGSANTLTVNGLMVNTQANTLVLQNGTFVSTAANSTAFTAGVLQIGGGSATPAVLNIAAAAELPASGAALVLDNGTLQNNTGSSLAIASPLTLDSAGGIINTAGQSVTISGPIGGSGALAMAGGGSVVLSNAATYSGQTTVKAGNLELGSAGGVIDGTSALNVAGGAVVILNNSYSNNGITINYTAGSSPNATIRNEIITGYNGGAWNGTSTTGGVINSAAAAGSGGKYAIGYADGADGVVSGLGSTQEKVMLTLPGDATLAGRVTLNDFTIMLNHFGTASGAQWDQGDFNYDGKVNLQDFTIWLDNYGQSLSSPPLFSGRELIGSAAVPEPTSITLIVASVGMLMLYGRRRQVDPRNSDISIS